MKKIFIILFAIVTACVPDEYGSLFPYAPFVQITTPAVKVPENNDPSQAVVKFQYVGPTLTQDLTINLGVTVTGSGVTQPPSTVVIKAGEFATQQVITFTNNNVNDGDKVVKIQLVSTSSDAVSIATKGTTKDNGTITIVDDDCPFNINDYVGTYNMDLVASTAFLYGDAGDYPDNAVVLTAGDDENTLVDADFALVSQVGFDAVPVTIKLDPTSLTSTLVGDKFNFLDGTKTDNAVVAYNTAPNRRVFTNAEEAGQISTCAKSFSVHVYIQREDGSKPQELILTYVKQ